MRAMKTHKKLQKIQIQESVLITFLGIVLLFFCLLHIKNLNQIIVLNDEFGYWSIASSLAGKDWLDLISNTPYYNFGYSILLVPLYYLGIPSYTMYKVAILYNAIFVFLGFRISIACGKKIFPTIDKKVIIFISFIISCYPNVLVQSQIAWTESILNLMFWVTVFVLLSIVESPKLWKIMVFIVVLSYMYYVHQRTIGIVLSGVLILLLLSVSKNISFKYMLISLLLLGAIFVIHIFIKGELKLWLWSNSGLSNMNDFSSQSSLLSAIFSKVGMSSVFYGFFGRIFYFLVAGGILWYCGIIHILSNFFNSIRKNILKITSPIVIMEIFVLLSFLATMAIGLTSVAKGFARWDSVVYGRYIENTVGPLLLIGGGVLYQKRPSVKQMLGYVFLVFISGSITIHVLQIMGNSTFVDLCSVGLANFFENSGGKDAIIKAIEYTLIINGVVCFSLFCSEKKKRTFLVVGILILFSWLWEANYSYSHTIKYMQDDKIENNEPIADMLKRIIVNEIYYVKDENLDSYSINPKYLQFWIPDISIRVIDSSKVEDIPIDSILLVEKAGKSAEELIKDTKVLKESKEFYVCTQMDSKVISELKDAGESFEKALDLSGADSENWDNESDGVCSNGEDGFLVKNYKVKLSAGSYKVKFNLAAVDTNNKKTLGKCLITKFGGNEILKEVEINEEFLKAENNLIEFSTIDTEDIEFSLEVERGVILEVYSITYEKINNNYLVGQDSIKDIEEILNNIENIYPRQINYVSNHSKVNYDFSYLQELFTNIEFKFIDSESKNDFPADTYILLERENVDLFEYLKKYDCLMFNGTYILFTEKTNNIALNWQKNGRKIFTEGFIDIDALRMETDGTINTDNIISLKQGTYEMVFDSTNLKGNIEIYVEGQKKNIVLGKKDKIRISIRDNKQSISWRVNSLQAKQPQILIKQIDNKYHFELSKSDQEINPGKEIEIPLFENLNMGRYNIIFKIMNLSNKSDVEIILYKKVDTVNENPVNLVDINVEQSGLNEFRIEHQFNVERDGNRQIKCVIKNKSNKKIFLESIQFENVN